MNYFIHWSSTQYLYFIYFIVNFFVWKLALNSIYSILAVWALKCYRFKIVYCKHNMYDFKKKKFYSLSPLLVVDFKEIKKTDLPFEKFYS